MNKSKRNKIFICVLMLIAIITIVYSFSFNVLGGTFNISITNNPNAANGKGGLTLDWSSYNRNDTVYKVYKKMEGTSNFQSISTIDLENKEENAKVLNVYPDIAQSNSLKTWMETNGYGLGKIDVTPISMTEFNTNPEGYLKKFSNDWAYDIVVFGTFDVNNWKDISSSAVNILRNFHASGRGILFGHDTILQGYNDNFFSLKDLVNIEAGGATPYLTKIRIKKTGLLTNYPYDLMNKDGYLIVPPSHTTSQTANGDIWMEYADYESGKSNFYLTTWNNAAMIQTGHSNGQATDDEQRLFANTLFYLKQITSVKSRTDNSAQDLASPNKPVFTSYSQSNNSDRIYFTASDNGTTYSYYVESYNKNNTSQVIDTSNIQSGISTTGVKGYYYIIDNNKTLNFNKNTAGVKYTTNNYIDVSNNGNQYIHIFAIDGAGNTGPIADIGPKVNIKGNITWNEKDGYTSKRPNNVTINLYRNDVLINSIKTLDTFDFGTLEKKDNNGNNYNYRIEQTGLDNSIYSTVINTNNILNTTIYNIENTLIAYPNINIEITKKIDFKNLDDRLLKDNLNNKQLSIFIKDIKTNNIQKIRIKNNEKIILSNLLAGHSYEILESPYSNLIFKDILLKTNNSNISLVKKENKYILSIDKKMVEDININIESLSEIEINNLVENNSSKTNLIYMS